jgi:hypothetical protein
MKLTQTEDNKTPCTRYFRGNKPCYQIKKGDAVKVIKFYPKRKALVEYQGKLILTLTTLLRRNTF